MPMKTIGWPVVYVMEIAAPTRMKLLYLIVKVDRGSPLSSIVSNFERTIPSIKRGLLLWLNYKSWLV